MKKVAQKKTNGTKTYTTVALAPTEEREPFEAVVARIQAAHHGASPVGVLHYVHQRLSQIAYLQDSEIDTDFIDSLVESCELIAAVRDELRTCVVNGVTTLAVLPGEVQQ